MSRYLDKLEKVRGLPVLLGVALVLLNFVVQVLAYFLIPPGQAAGFVLFLFTEGNLLLHLGIVVGVLGILVGDII
ncbi:MAG: hypothetical protein ACP5JJ_18340 [Anaerolineae bacterium]